MRPYWLIAKYVSDLKRREPVNVGVVFRDGDYVAWRFIGQRADGTFDRRRLRWAGSPENYQGWVEFWTHALARNASLEELLNHTSDSNYFLEFGGERFMGRADDIKDTFLDNLYTMLVEAHPDRDTLSIARLSEIVLVKVGIRDLVQSKFKWTIGPANDVRDEVVFDYRYDNGAIHLMHRVQLSYGDERSWEAVHAAAWAFRLAQANRIQEGREQNLIALVKTRNDDIELERQLGLLEKHTTAVVNVTHEELAATQLRQLLHVTPSPPAS